MKRDFHGKIFPDAISEDSKEHTVLGKNQCVYETKESLSPGGSGETERLCVVVLRQGLTLVQTQLELTM